MSSNDVERGLSEESDTLQPLLSSFLQRSNGLQGVEEGCETKPQLNLIMTDGTSSTAGSSLATTPLTETELWPKKWRRNDRRLRRLNTELLEAIVAHNDEEVERLLRAGANPNATCRLDLVSACHMAALAGGDSLRHLVRFGAEKHRLDRLGRTPLHIAAWAGNARQVAVLLDFPDDMYDRVEDEQMSSDAEEDVRRLCPLTKEMVNVRSDLGEVNMILPKTWKDNIDHDCIDIKGVRSIFKPGFTPLHAAATRARPHCTRLLLAAGADPNVLDEQGCTPLDVAGSAFATQGFTGNHFTDVIRMLLKAGGKHNTMKFEGLNNFGTPLHVAVELDCLDAINELLNAGASIACLNAEGETPLHICVRKRLEIPLQVLANYGQNNDPLSAMVDVKDEEGHSVLQAAVEAAWVPGVCVALEAGADVTLKANDGETPIHSAAALGNVDVLTEILSIAKQKQTIDWQNEKGETPLFKAITNGHVECVQALLNEGASLKVTLPREITTFHVAAEKGNLEILKHILEFDEDTTKVMINSLTAGDRKGYGPIHFAVENDNLECVKLLLSKNADIRLRTTSSPHMSSTPLHVAAVKNRSEIANVLLNNDKTIIHEVNGMGWFPLHSAAHHGSKEVIILLLREGADLSGYTDGPQKFRKTAMSMIIDNLPKPTEFLEDVLDSYITANSHNLQENGCEIVIDYRVLMPRICEMEQMKVVEALIKTGNRHGQRRLLVHPLIESFLYLKWKALLPFFYTIIVCYALFLVSLTVFIVSVYFYKDTQDQTPYWLNTNLWGNFIYVTTATIFLLELLYMNTKTTRYLYQLETWLKFATMSLAIILPTAVIIASSEAEWIRHVATMAILLSWLEMMFLLSRFPNWGYYVLMFGKVASNVVKILLTFFFLVIGFSLSFMIQFRSQMPFEGPWAALVKTMVMMTSEFDYQALFDEEHSKQLATSLLVVRFIFVVFLILAAIVLMNLMVGVAVNDINDLEVLGNIRRLVKQAEFLSTLDTLVYNKLFNKIFTNKVNESLKRKRSVQAQISLCPGSPRWRRYKLLTSHLREAIFNKAQRQKKQMDEEISFQKFQTKMNEMYDAIVTKNTKEVTNNTDHENTLCKPIEKSISHLDLRMKEVKEDAVSNIHDTNANIERLNVKMDQMSLEMEEIKQFLCRLENKLVTQTT